MGLQPRKQRLVVMLEVKILQPQLGVFDGDLSRDVRGEIKTSPRQETPVGVPTEPLCPPKPPPTFLYFLATL